VVFVLPPAAGAQGAAVGAAVGMPGGTPGMPGGTSLRSLPVGLRAWSHSHRQADSEASRRPRGGLACPSRLACRQPAASLHPHMLADARAPAFLAVSQSLRTWLCEYDEAVHSSCPESNGWQMPVSLGVAPLASATRINLPHTQFSCKIIAHVPHVKFSRDLT